MSSLAPNATPRQRSQLSSFNASFYSPQNRQAANNSQAQPVPPQSQGTPYGSPTTPPPPGMVYNKAPSSQPANFSAYQPQQQTNSSPYQPAQQASSNPFAQYNPQQIGNFVQQQMGLPSFQFTATDSFGNTYDNPAALTAQQGAMAQALNAQRGQQIQSGSIGRLDPTAAYQQARNMVQGGWTNPFAQQPPAQQQFAGLYAPGTDMSTLPFTDTLQPNPLYRPPALPGGQGQAQPVQPPSQGTPYGQPLQASPARPGYTRTPDGRLLYSGPPEVGLQAPPRQAPPPSQAAPPRSYADERRAQDQAAYEELMQQIRTGGGSMADNMRADRRKADLERRLGMTQAPAQPGAAQPPVIHQHSPNDTLNYEPGPYRPGTFQPIAWGPDGMKGTADDQPYTRPVGNPGQAQPIQQPSPGTRYGTPVVGTPPFDPDYAKWRGQQFQTMEYRGPEREAARERDMYQRYLRERGGPQPSPDAYYPGDVFFPPAGQAQPVRPPRTPMPILRPHNDPSNPTRQMPQPWITTNVGGREFSVPPRPATPRRQPFFY